MNIFVLDTRAGDAARAHCDKHVVKMPLETGQMLSTAMHLIGRPDERLYRPAYQNHPCTVWVRSSYANFMWAYVLFRHLLSEYSYRYGREHATARLVPVLSTVSADDFPSYGMTPFAQAMPDQCRRDDAVTAYRTYYATEKARLLTYRKRQPPEWLKDFSRPVTICS